jgi:hypothetical protein
LTRVPLGGDAARGAGIGGPGGTRDWGMAPKNKDVEKVRKEFEDFKKEAKKIKNDKDRDALRKKVKKYYRGDIVTLLLDNRELDLKKQFDDLVEQLSDPGDDFEIDFD